MDKGMSKRVLSTQCHEASSVDVNPQMKGVGDSPLIVHATARGRKGILIFLKQPRVSFFFTSNDRKVAPELVQRVRVFGSKREDLSS